TIEKLQEELASISNAVIEAVAPAPKRRGPKGRTLAPTDRRSAAARRKSGTVVQTPSAAAAGKRKGRRAGTTAARKARLRDVVTGSSVGEAPVASEPKTHGPKPPKGQSAKKKRNMSAAGRARIAAAQKRRWAKHNATKRGK